jgi:hypothetical protein
VDPLTWNLLLNLAVIDPLIPAAVEVYVVNHSRLIPTTNMLIMLDDISFSLSSLEGGASDDSSRPELLILFREMVMFYDLCEVVPSTDL